MNTKKIPVTCDPHGRLERRPLADLTPFQGDFKDLDEARYKKLKASILAEGFMAPVFVWNDRILDGHQRTVVLGREGWDIEGGVPVVEIEADNEAEAARKLLKLTSAYGKPSPEGVFDFMQTHDLTFGDFADVDLPDFDEDALAMLFGEDGLDEDGPSDDALEPPVAPVSRLGDMWNMGKHRVLCGDSTDDSATSRLLAGDTPFLMVTDPPYGVQYDPTWRTTLPGVSDEKAHQLRQQGVDKTDGRMGLVQNDDRADWTEAWALFPGDVAYIWHAATQAALVERGLTEVDFQLRSQIIWNKPHLVLSRGAYHWKHESCWYAVRDGQQTRWCGDLKQFATDPLLSLVGEAAADEPGRNDYNWGHEPCWYAVRDGQTAKWCGDRKQSTVWDIDGIGGDGDNAKGFGHSTQKPIECMARPIRNHGKPGDIIYDPFLGSGTTLVAAHAERRICRGMEIDPAYVDVSVIRWQAYTGNEAVNEYGRTFSEVKADRDT